MFMLEFPLNLTVVDVEATDLMAVVDVEGNGFKELFSRCYLKTTGIRVKKA